MVLWDVRSLTLSFSLFFCGFSSIIREDELYSQNVCDNDNYVYRPADSHYILKIARDELIYNEFVCMCAKNVMRHSEMKLS